MQAVILAAGRGIRMGSLTEATPKPMALLSGKPILDYKIRYLPPQIDEVILVVGHHQTIIQDYFKDLFFGRRIQYAIQEELNGTGGALSAARRRLTDRFLVLMADDLYMKSDLEKLIMREAALLAYALPEDALVSIVKVDEYGQLQGVPERQPAKQGDPVNAGAYVLTRKFFDYPLVKWNETEYGLPQTIATMTHDIPVAVVFAEQWKAITTTADLDIAEKVLNTFYPSG